MICPRCVPLPLTPLSLQLQQRSLLRILYYLSDAGCVSFLTFFKYVPRLLVFDRSNAMEVAFRMCSRRGATCEPQNAVLDEKDIRTIVEHR